MNIPDLQHGKKAKKVYEQKQTIVVIFRTNWVKSSECTASESAILA